MKTLTGITSILFVGTYSEHTQRVQRAGRYFGSGAPRITHAHAPASQHIDFGSTWCYPFVMGIGVQAERTFKTAWFSKEARKARIRDDELCEAIKEVRKGQADDLGGGVFKKRLNKNMHRSIVLAKGGRYWIYQYLFAKKDLDNIEDNELSDFRMLAKGYASLAEDQVDVLLKDKDLVEICHAVEE